MDALRNDTFSETFNNVVHLNAQKKVKENKGTGKKQAGNPSTPFFLPCFLWVIVSKAIEI